MQGGGERPDVRYPKVIWNFDLVCMDRRDGKVIWRKTCKSELPHEGYHQDHGFASHSPVTDGKYVWVNYGSRGVYCFDVEGDLVWSREFGKMEIRRGYGEASSPALIGELLVVVMDQEGDSFIAALDKGTGETVWRTDRDEPTTWATPIAVELEGKKQLAVSGTNFSRVYDLASGEVMHRWSGQTVNAIPSPVSGDGMLFFTSGYRGNCLQGIALDGEEAPKIKWEVNKGTPYVPSPLLYGGKLYVIEYNRGNLSCYEAGTGKELYFKEKLPGLWGVYGSPVGVAGRVYVVGRRGAAVVLAAGDEFEVLATNVLDDEFDCSPVVIGDELYLKGKKYIYCIAEGTPAQNRTFSEKPEILLGLKLDRSASLNFVDVDSDSDLDVLVANGRHWPQANEVFINNGKGRFTIGYLLGVELSTSYAVPAGDLDGDGDRDVVVANDSAENMIYQNDGLGRFSLAGALGPEVEPTRGVQLADLNGDGKLDALVTNRGAENGIYLNKGDLQFGKKRGFGTSNDATISLAVTDMNQDGYPDLILANRDSQGNEIYLNDSAMSFTKSHPFGEGNDQTRGVAIADMDGDDHLDIVTANIGQANGVYFGNSTGRFDEGIRFGRPGGQTYAVVVADMDKDGDSDIVTGNVRMQNAVYFNDGTGRSFVEVRFGGVEDNSYGVAVGDVNADGYPDIGIANSDGLNGIYLNRPGRNR
ncbi:MAG: PQQ-binding-like beta-propeller repeat protein [Planctomycetes bacterium]|nr:PQQ-binding-like beta-propeller repeat protein [Planctomycetota bacterium]